MANRERDNGERENQNFILYEEILEFKEIESVLEFIVNITDTFINLINKENPPKKEIFLMYETYNEINPIKLSRNEIEEIKNKIKKSYRITLFTENSQLILKRGLRKIQSEILVSQEIAEKSDLFDGITKESTEDMDSLELKEQQKKQLSSITDEILNEMTSNPKREIKLSHYEIKEGSTEQSMLIHRKESRQENLGEIKYHLIHEKNQVFPYQKYSSIRKI